MQSLERELYGNIASIREFYENGAAITDMDVSERFRQSGALCAGSFVFYHCGRAWPLHEKTKRELYAFLMCAKRIGVIFPAFCARRIAELVQWSELASDYAKQRMNIDIFLCASIYLSKSDEHDALRELFPHVGHGLWREYGIDTNSRRGFYALQGLFNVGQFRKFELRERDHERPRLPLNLSFLFRPRPLEFLHKRFDADFCKNNFYDGRLEIVCADMIGEMHVQKYLEIAKEILVVHEDEHREWLRILRTTVQERLEKYERRRFTITNASEVREFIAQLVPPYRFLQREFTE